MGDNERLEDVQEMSAGEIRVYEAVASLNVDRREATVREIAAMVQLPDETVRRCLDALCQGGRLVPQGETYLLGPHDWGLDY
jgi:DNA-binding IclR family transcriptional regulator